KNARGQIVEDTIALELARAMGPDLEVPPATVLLTGPGSLRTNGVKWIFHVAAVVGEPREGYRTVTRLDQCVKNALRRTREPQFRKRAVTSVLFPIFGTGPGGGDLGANAEVCFNAAIEFMDTMTTP